MTGRVKVALAVDADEWAMRTYRQNLGQHAWTAKIGEVDLPDVACNILLAGPPCQDYSSLSTQAGTETDRGLLFEEVAVALDKYRARSLRG